MTGAVAAAVSIIIYININNKNNKKHRIKKNNFTLLFLIWFVILFELKKKKFIKVGWWFDNTKLWFIRFKIRKNNIIIMYYSRLQDQKKINKRMKKKHFN